MKIRIILNYSSYILVSIQFIIIISFHFYREDHNPIMQTMSEYTIGQFGYFFPIALLILGFSSLLSFFSLKMTLPKSDLGKKILRYFLLWSLFIILTGIFPTDYITGPYTISGIIHALASYFAFLFLLISIYFIALFFRKRGNSKVDSTRFYIYFFLAIPGLIIFLIIPLDYKGLIQRIFLGIILIAYIDIITIPLRKSDFQDN